MNTSNASLTPDASSFDGAWLSIFLALDGTEIVFFSLTILLALAYTALIIIRPTFRRNKLNWFTVNICLSSVLFCVFLLNLTIRDILNIPNDLPCRIQGYLIIVAVCQVLNSHCVASFCRFLAIVYAMKHLFRSSAFTWLCIGFGWLIGILTATPYLVLDGFICSDESQLLFLSYYTIVVTLALPMAILAVCNNRIFWFVRRSTRQVHAEAGRNNRPQRRDIQLMKALIGTFFIMVIGWTPIFLRETLLKSATLPIAVEIVIQVLPSVSMLLDVCLLIYTNQPVRHYLKQLILRKDQEGIAMNTIRL